MADHLKVDPIDLHMSAAHMDVHHADLRAVHAAADGAIEGAQAGWVGASAAALQSKMAEWQATTTRLCGDIASRRPRDGRYSHHPRRDRRGQLSVDRI
jgi:WXG100 family type VII secretion target